MVGQKRKRGTNAHKLRGQSENEIKTEISLFEEQIKKSSRHYNKIQSLMGYASGHEYPLPVQRQAWGCLCKLFSVLLAAGKMTRTQLSPDKTVEVVKDWLTDRLKEFSNILLSSLSTSDQDEKSLALQLLMQLFKEECNSAPLDQESHWMTGTFSRILIALIETKGAHRQRLEFVHSYVLPYNDVRLYAFCILRQATHFPWPKTMLS